MEIDDAEVRSAAMTMMTIMRLAVGWNIGWRPVRSASR
jgi:hypothetical protein